ncbi:MAG: hypothetical protein KJ904_03745 [Alphaproteobacteria bacterium]|nr:hypothetical protein [Alphaproteobacteria bacterium]MBU0799053.1 hypothetical protein [Alphaproteobacteria bacterium]MBU0886254.1 hypothetical protein [Alphaproteobacteria bacterium]MBU1815099.1 hypothetical protein [Alphaproteobacteria bacterium]
MLLDSQKGRLGRAAASAATTRSSIATGRRVIRLGPASNDNKPPKRDGFLPRIALILALAGVLTAAVLLNN